MMLHLTDAESTAFELLQSGGESDIHIERGAKRPRLLKSPRPNNPNDASVLLQREAFVLGRLEPHGIAPAYLGPGPTREGRQGLLLEYLMPPWRTLSLHFELAEHDVPRKEAVKLSGAIIDVVERMHQAGIVHADLKPSNVMVHPTTLEVKLIDFSSAYLADRPDHRGFVTYSGVYTDPRTLTPPFTPDMASDDYSTAVMCFELLTGQRAGIWFDMYQEKAKKTGIYPLYQKVRGRHWLVSSELAALDAALKR